MKATALELGANKKRTVGYLVGDLVVVDPLGDRKTPLGTLSGPSVGMSGQGLSGAGSLSETCHCGSSHPLPRSACWKTCHFLSARWLAALMAGGRQVWRMDPQHSIDM